MNYRQLLSAFVIILSVNVLIISIHHFKKTSLAKEDDLPAGMTKYDFMKELLLQEFNKTKDPRLNSIPKERLLTAKQYMYNRLASQKAISGIQWTERGPSNVGGRTRALLFDLNAC